MGHETKSIAGPRRQALLEAMHRDLHALCQPLTALHCRLELGRMQGDAASLRAAVEESLAESQRLFAAVARMRACLRAEESPEVVGRGFQGTDLV